MKILFSTIVAIACLASFSNPSFAKKTDKPIDEIKQIEKSEKKTVDKQSVEAKSEDLPNEEVSEQKPSEDKPVAESQKEVKPPVSDPLPKKVDVESMGSNPFEGTEYKTIDVSVKSDPNPTVDAIFIIFNYVTIAALVVMVVSVGMWIFKNKDKIAGEDEESYGFSDKSTSESKSSDKSTKSPSKTKKTSTTSSKNSSAKSTNDKASAPKPESKDQDSNPTNEIDSKEDSNGSKKETSGTPEKASAKQPNKRTSSKNKKYASTQKSNSQTKSGTTKKRSKKSKTTNDADSKSNESKKMMSKIVVNSLFSSLLKNCFIAVCVVPIVSSCSSLQPKENLATAHFSSEAWQQQFDWYQDQEDADFLFYVRRFDKAEILAKSAIEKAKKFGENDPRLARSLTSLARVQIEKSEFDNAIKSLNKSYKIKSAKFGMKNTDVADILSEIAYANLKMGNIEEAKKTIQQSIAIRKNVKDVFGDMDSNYIEGLILEKENKSFEASTKFAKCIEIYSNNLNNPIESLSTDHLNRMKNCFQIYIALKKKSNPTVEYEKAEENLQLLTAWLNILGQSGI